MDSILRQELYARRQGPLELLAIYTEDIIKRFQRPSLNDNELMNVFINGLSPELKSHVVLTQFCFKALIDTLCTVVLCDKSMTKHTINTSTLL